MARTPSKFAALVRVIAKASEMLGEGSESDRRIGEAVGRALREVVAEEMGSGVPGIIEAELRCGRLDVFPDGTSLSYHFDTTAYQAPE